MEEELYNQLETLVKTPGISGNESRISKRLRAYYAPYCDEIVYDNLGSIFAVKKSKNKEAKRVLISAHMDELGFIVKEITDNGTVIGLALGKMNQEMLLGEKIILTTVDDTTYEGVILGLNKQKLASVDDIEIVTDFGFENKAEVEKSGVSLGDMLTFSGDFFSSKNEKVWFGSNWNSRITASQTIDILKSVANVQLDFDLYVGCTVQESVGLRGAQTATNLVAPDLAIALNGRGVEEVGQDNAAAQPAFLGKGPLLTYYDTTVLPNRLVLSDAKKVCREKEIPYQLYYSLEGSDAGWINKLRTGCPTLLLGMPIRNYKMPRQVVSEKDYHSLVKLASVFIENLSSERIQLYKEENR